MFDTATLHYIQSQHPWFVHTLVFVFGACVGSFLNVVIYRLPKGESVITPGSHNAQGDPIAWYDNLPILSWFILRGRDRKTGQPFSFRYPLIEALTAGLFLACWVCLAPQSPTLALLGMVFVSLLIPAAFIDLDHMMLPDIFTVGGTLLGLFLAFVFPQLHGYSGDFWFQEALRSGFTALMGVLIGSSVIVWIMVSAETLLRREAMGMGDVVLMGCIGAFCGWQGALFAIFGGACLGTLIMLPLMAWRYMRGDPMPQPPSADGEKKEGSPDPAHGVMGAAIPFGPWLALGGSVYFIAWREGVDAYLADMLAIVLNFPTSG